MTNHCDRGREIVRLIAGELAGAERRELEEHLSGCPACREEREAYARTLAGLELWEEEAPPRHFFVRPEERETPWRLFRRMHPLWQAATAAAALFLVLLSGVGGWSLAAGRTADPAAFREEILRAAGERQRAADEALVREIRAEIERARAESSGRQREYVDAALSGLDRKFGARLAASEERTGEDTRRLVAAAYHLTAQQRALDLNVINARFDTIEAVDAIKTRQTRDILGTLLEQTELRMR
jgi:anti-sigma factor RsiW